MRLDKSCSVHQPLLLGTAIGLALAKGDKAVGRS